MIDLHCHVLPGIDDGPATIEDSLTLARAAAAAGTRVIVATPHVSWHYPNEPRTIARMVDELNARLTSEAIELEVLPGAELAMSRIADMDRAQLDNLTLGGGDWLLVEPPFIPTAYGMDAIVLDLQRRGHRVILAHPERCAAFHRDPRMLTSLVDAGVLTSLTAGSLVGRFGGEVRRFAVSLVAMGLVHNIASDAHDDVRRPPGMAVELEQAGLGPLVEWLTQLVPAAILDGEEIPARPAVDLTDIGHRHPQWRRLAPLRRKLRSS
jgi:protein-tyrosine phosphatase